MTGSSCSVPRVQTVPVSRRNSRPPDGGRPSHRAVSTRRTWPCATSATSPSPRNADARSSTRSTRSPTCSDGLARVVGVAGDDPVPPQVPAGPLLPDLRRRHALVAAVVPLPQVGVRLDGEPAVEARQLRGPPRPCRRAGEHRDDPPPGQHWRQRRPRRPRPCGVSGTSVRPVCFPARLHSVWPWRSKISSPMGPIIAG